MFTRDLRHRDAARRLLRQVDRDLAAGLVSTRPTGRFEWESNGEAVRIHDADTESVIELPASVALDLLRRWCEHLEQVPEQLGRAASEAAAAQQRVAAMSWLESGVAVAAGHGWTSEASGLDAIRSLIDGGASSQVAAMRDAAASWHRVRDAFIARRPGDASVAAITAALDGLFSAGG